MYQYTLYIDGMACGMCEAHVNDCVRAAARVKKVSSSHRRGETVILSEQPLDVESLKAALAATGYPVRQLTQSMYQKKRTIFG